MMEQPSSEKLEPYRPEIHADLVAFKGEWFCRYQENDIYVFNTTERIRSIPVGARSKVFKYTQGDTSKMKDPAYYNSFASSKRREMHMPMVMTLEMVEAMATWAGDEMIYIKPGAKAKVSFKQQWFDSDYEPNCLECGDSKLDFTKGNPRPCPQCAA